MKRARERLRDIGRAKNRFPLFREML